MSEFTKTNPKDLWNRLAESVLNMDEGETALLAEEVLDCSFSPRDAIMNGLAEGMLRVGQRFAQKIYFVPEILVCAEAMYAGFNILKDHVPNNENMYNGSVVIGVVEGDFHDIGKNIVSLLLQASGFEVHDLGKNVPAAVFVEKVREIRPDIVALSTLLTTTLEEVKNIIDMIRVDSSDKTPKIMIGGAPVTANYAQEIGADFFGEDAQKAVEGAKILTELYTQEQA